MNATATTPPDMTREQARELKQLRAREARLTKTLSVAERRNRARIARLRDEIDRNWSRLSRELGVQSRAFAKPLRAEIRQLTTQLHRATEKRTPEHRELAAIAKRIGILEGRLGS
jgi:hypothetical protein